MARKSHDRGWNRIISDSEARQIIDRYNQQHRTNIKYDYPRESGKMFNADTMSLQGTKNRHCINSNGF
ncbi:MAG: hypothetical protein J6T12_10045 [Salinivirgaceae bacterium]|nr:hypothetical protein [Salinivirgaceae bacterium]